MSNQIVTQLAIEHDLSVSKVQILWNRAALTVNKRFDYNDTAQASTCAIVKNLIGLITANDSGNKAITIEPPPPVDYTTHTPKEEPKKLTEKLKSPKRKSAPEHDLKLEFKQALAKSSVAVSPKLMVPQIWEVMTEQEQEAYLKKHAGPSEQGPLADKAVEKIWENLSPKQKTEHAAKHPGTALLSDEAKQKASDEEARQKAERAKKQSEGDGDNKPKSFAEWSKEKRKAGKKPTKAGYAKHKAAHKQKTRAQAARDRVDGTDQVPKNSREHMNSESPESRTWWDKKNARAQAAYLRKHPKSKMAKRHRGIVRNLVGKASNAIAKKASELGKPYREGMAGLRNLSTGKPMTEHQKQGLKKTSIMVAGAVLASVMVLAVFTPLGPFALDLGEEYLDYLKSQKDALDSSESGVNIHTQVKAVKEQSDVDPESKYDAETLKAYTKGMTEWLLEQDVPALANKFKSKHEKS